MREGLSWHSGRFAAVVVVATLAVGCEARTQQTPPEPTQAWSDAPLWYDNSALLVPRGVRSGNSTPEQRAAARKKDQEEEDRERSKRQERQEARQAEAPGVRKEAKEAKVAVSTPRR